MLAWFMILHYIAVVSYCYLTTSATTRPWSSPATTVVALFVVAADSRAARPSSSGTTTWSSSLSPKTSSLSSSVLSSNVQATHISQRQQQQQRQQTLQTTASRSNQASSTSSTPRPWSWWLDPWSLAFFRKDSVPTATTANSMQSSGTPSSSTDSTWLSSQSNGISHNNHRHNWTQIFEPYLSPAEQQMIQSSTNTATRLPPTVLTDVDVMSLEGRLAKTDDADHDRDEESLKDDWNDSQEESESNSRLTNSTSYTVQAKRHRRLDDTMLETTDSHHDVPVVYRYYERDPRAKYAQQIPFILLGPNVDHWKGTGQELASRGYSVIACERLAVSSAGPTQSTTRSTHETTTKTKTTTTTTAASTPLLTANEAADLIVTLMDALRWKRAVLVGCDHEAVLAMQAALQLSPDRIVGLILCGDLEQAEVFVAREASPAAPLSTSPDSRIDATAAALSPTLFMNLAHGTDHHDHFELDRFLFEEIACPFRIVWDGSSNNNNNNNNSDEPIVASAARSMVGSGPAVTNRSLMIGVGTAPHRKSPRLFAWVLTRFVEERIFPLRDMQHLSTPRRNGNNERRNASSSLISNSNDEIKDKEANTTKAPPLAKGANALFVRLGEFFTSESMVVMGRMLATALFYGAMIKVGLHQLENLKSGYVHVKAKVEMVSSMQQRILRTILDTVSVMFTGVASIFTWRPRWRRKSSDEPMDGSDISKAVKDPEHSTNPANDDDRDHIDLDQFNPESTIRPMFFLDNVVA